MGDKNGFVQAGFFKGIVHFEINFCYVLAYLNGIQDVGFFVSTVFSVLIILGQAILVCQFLYPEHTNTQ